MISHPIQYYSPWFRWLAAAGWNLRVFYLWDFGIVPRTDREFGRPLTWDVDLLSGYEHEFMPNRAAQPGTHHLRGLDNPTLPDRLRAWQPDVVLLFGYKYLTHLRLIFGARYPLVFRGDSHLLDAPNLAFAKRWLLGLIYGRFAAVTYVGRANRAYFRALGVAETRLVHAPHAVDAAHFTATPERRAQAARLRTDLGLDGHRVLLFAGKLIPKKQPLELLEAFLAAGQPGTALVFVGDGQERAALETLAATRPDRSVRFLPFANQSEMPVRYLLADVFVLPSRGPEETWGLAVNEAMHLGVPCLVSDRVGCQQDLVTEGETGWVFSAHEPGALAAALGRVLATDPTALARIRDNGAQRIAGYTYATAAAGLAEAVTVALARR
ncbi:glycosyltransferase family 4 protein [Lacunisphaera limnophila]|uniref:glycosyltransferase family 4 protein n=1 Tax=Lacunisphaera limnophila TaxID=1838286 RepID=UPI0014726ABD|nr:glycosyltransferase family 4 protein [Lacunisphaera limnophila]